MVMQKKGSRPCKGSTQFCDSSRAGAEPGDCMQCHKLMIWWIVLAFSNVCVCAFVSIGSTMILYIVQAHIKPEWNKLERTDNPCSVRTKAVSFSLYRAMMSAVFRSLPNVIEPYKSERMKNIIKLLILCLAFFVIYPSLSLSIVLQRSELFG